MALDEIKVLQAALMKEHDKKEIQRIEAIAPKKESIPDSTVTFKKETKVTTKTTTITQDSVSEIWNQILKKLKLFNGIFNFT